MYAFLVCKFLVQKYGCVNFLTNFKSANKWITVLYLWGQNMYKLKLREASEADETGSDANRVRLITLLSLTWPPPVTTITGTSQYIHLF